MLASRRRWRGGISVELIQNAGADIRGELWASTPIGKAHDDNNYDKTSRDASASASILAKTVFHISTSTANERRLEEQPLSRDDEPCPGQQTVHATKMQEKYSNYLLLLPTSSYNR